MIRWFKALMALLLVNVAGTAFAQTCTTTLNSGGDLVAAIGAAAAGSTICLNPGTYTPSAAAFPADGNTFAIFKRLNVIGRGTSPSQVILQGNGAASGNLLWFVNAGTGNNASGSLLQNVTLQNAQGGVQIQDFLGNSRLTDITIKDVIINTTAPSQGRGVLAIKADRLVVDNVTVTSYLDSFFFTDVTDSVLMNSTANYTNAGTGGVALALNASSNNIVVNNTFGTGPAPGAQYAYTFAVAFNNSPANRFENNLVRFFRHDGVDFTARNDVAPVQKSVDIYAGKNTITSSARSLGEVAGAAMWANCGSDRAWMFGNDNSGVPECGICSYTSTSNMALGNTLHDNGIVGFLLSGGAETAPFCPVAAYQERPTNTFVKSNAVFWNINDQVYIRSADSTEVASNHMSPRNGFGGALRPEPCQTQFCQSALTIDTQGTTPATNGVRVVWNINHENTRGISADDGKDINLEVAYNRMIQSNLGLAYSRYIRPGSVTSTNWDGGPVTGGNYWSLFPTPNGNPGNAAYGTPSSGDSTRGVFDSGTNSTGAIVDRYAYKSENMGRDSGVTVFEPRSAGAGAQIARGTKRTVRWYSPGCVYNEISLDNGGTMLQANAPNTGYAIVTIPAGLAPAAHRITIACKDSAGNWKSSSSSLAFNVTDGSLQLLAPGRDDVFNAGSTIWVAWTKTSAVTSVAIDLSTDGGTSFTTLATGLTGTTARVTLPGTAAAATAVMRVRSLSTAAQDMTDGWFAIRGTGQGFINMSGRVLTMGQQERLEWASPASSRTVTITATSGGVTKTVAGRLPDRGSFDWIVPEMPAGAVTLNATFLDAGDALAGTATNSAGVVSFPTTITFATLPSTLAVGASVAPGGATNSGVGVTYTSLTPSVCTVSGGVVTGVSAGTCTVQADAAGNATYNSASGIVSFNVASISNPARLGNISTRMQTLTGNDVMIGGFVINGFASKTVAVVATGPSLVPFGIANALQDPTLQLVRSSDQTVIATNDDWGTAANAAQLQAAGFAPSNARESAILVTLPPGAYTAIVSGKNNSTGVAVVAVYEVDRTDVPLVNISTRGRVLTGNDVMIGGFVIQGSGNQTVVITATGPSLAQYGITQPLPDPSLTLVRSSDQAVLATNDNWQAAPNALQIQQAGFAPSHFLESAIMMSLPPGAYTAIVQGTGGTTGVGVVGVYTVP